MTGDPLTWRPVVRREAAGGVAILLVNGRLGQAGAGDLLEAIVDAIHGGVTRLVVDLSGVDYASSAGLLMLDAAAGRMHIAGGTLVLCGLTEPVRLALSLAGLFGQFVVADSREGAIRLADPPRA